VWHEYAVLSLLFDGIMVIVDSYYLHLEKDAVLVPSPVKLSKV